jgi:hypothetical protein
MDHQIFLSYGGRDREFAERLAKELNDRVLAVWRDSDLPYGHRWNQERSQAIDRSDVYVVLVGAEPSTSERNEWSTLLERSWTSGDKTMIPLLLPGAQPPAGLRTYPAIAVNGASPGDIAGVGEEIVHAVQQPRASRRARTSGTAHELRERLRMIDEAIAKLPGEVGERSDRPDDDAI